MFQRSLTLFSSRLFQGFLLIAVLCSLLVQFQNNVTVRAAEVEGFFAYCEGGVTTIGKRCIDRNNSDKGFSECTVYSGLNYFCVNATDSVKNSVPKAYKVDGCSGSTCASNGVNDAFRNCINGICKDKLVQGDGGLQTGVLDGGNGYKCKVTDQGGGATRFKYSLSDCTKDGTASPQAGIICAAYKTDDNATPKLTCDQKAVTFGDMGSNNGQSVLVYDPGANCYVFRQKDGSSTCIRKDEFNHVCGTVFNLNNSTRICRDLKSFDDLKKAIGQNGATQYFKDVVANANDITGKDATQQLSADCVEKTKAAKSGETVECGSLKLTKKDDGTVVSQTGTVFSQSGAQVLSSSTTGQGANPLKDVGEGLMEVLYKIVGIVILVLLFFVGMGLLWIAFVAGYIIIAFLLINPASTEFIQVAVPAWGSMVTVANLIVLIAFLTLALGYLLNIKALKKDLGEFILEVVIFTLLLNFSLLGVAAIVNIFQGIGDVVIFAFVQDTDPAKINYTLIGGIINSVGRLSRLRCGTLDPGEVCNVAAGSSEATAGFSEGFANLGTIISGNTDKLTDGIIRESIFIIFLFMVLWVFWKVLFLVVSRAVMVWLLMVTSPIALAAYFSPIEQIRQISTRWMDRFWKLLIFYPAFVFALILTGLVTRNFDVVYERTTSGRVTSFLDSVNVTAQTAGTVDLGRSFGAFVSATLAIAILFFIADFFEKAFEDIAQGLINGAKGLVGGIADFSSARWSNLKTAARVGGQLTRDVQTRGVDSRFRPKISKLQSQADAAEKSGDKVRARQLRDEAVRLDSERIAKIQDIQSKANWGDALDRFEESNPATLFYRRFKARGKEREVHAAGVKSVERTKIEADLRRRGRLGRLRYNENYQALAGYGEGAQFIEAARRYEDKNKRDLVNDTVSKAESEAKSKELGITANFDQEAKYNMLETLKKVRSAKDLTEEQKDALKQIIDDPSMRNELLSDDILRENIRSWFFELDSDLQDALNKHLIALNPDEKFVEQAVAGATSSEEGRRELNKANLRYSAAALRGASRFTNANDLRQMTQYRGLDSSVAFAQNRENPAVRERVERELFDEYRRQGLSEEQARTNANNVADEVMHTITGSNVREAAEGVDLGRMYIKLANTNKPTQEVLNEEYAKLFYGNDWKDNAGNVRGVSQEDYNRFVEYKKSQLGGSDERVATYIATQTQMGRRIAQNDKNYQKITGTTSADSKARLLALQVTNARLAQNYNSVKSSLAEESEGTAEAWSTAMKPVVAKRAMAEVAIPAYGKVTKIIRDTRDVKQGEDLLLKNQDIHRKIGVQERNDDLEGQVAQSPHQVEFVKSYHSDTEVAEKHIVNLEEGKYKKITYDNTGNEVNTEEHEVGMGLTPDEMTKLVATINLAASHYAEGKDQMAREVIDRAKRETFENTIGEFVLDQHLDAGNGSYMESVRIEGKNKAKKLIASGNAVPGGGSKLFDEVSSQIAKSKANIGNAIKAGKDEYVKAGSRDLDSFANRFRDVA